MIACLLSLTQLVVAFVIDLYPYLLLTGVVTSDLLWEAKLLIDSFLHLKKKHQKKKIYLSLYTESLLTEITGKGIHQQ